MMDGSVTERGLSVTCVTSSQINPHEGLRTAPGRVSAVPKCSRGLVSLAFGLGKESDLIIFWQ